MTRKDFVLIAGALAAVERINEEVPDPQGIGASTLRLVVDEIAGAIEREHPRFNRGRFEIAALPISSERMKQAIIKATKGGA